MRGSIECYSCIAQVWLTVALVLHKLFLMDSCYSCLLRCDWLNVMFHFSIRIKLIMRPKERNMTRMTSRLCLVWRVVWDVFHTLWKCPLRLLRSMSPLWYKGFKTWPYILAMIKMTIKVYLAWMVLKDAILALHKCIFKLRENSSFMLRMSKS